MEKLRLLDEVLTFMAETGSGDFFDTELEMDSGANSYKLTFSRSFGTIRFILNTKSRMGHTVEICNCTYGKHGGSEDGDSGFRLRSDPDYTEFAYLSRKNPTVGYATRVGNDELFFSDENLEETHFQFSTIGSVPPLEVCKETIMYKEHLDRLLDIELQYVLRVSVSTSKFCEKDAKFLLRAIKNTVEMASNDF